MKKTIICSFTGLFLACISTSFAYTQNQTGIAKLKLKPEIISSAQSSEEKEDDRILSDRVHIKAVRDFTKTYRNVTGTKWFRSGDGFVVYFIPKNDVKTKLYYDKQGNYQCKVRSYSEDRLPAEIRHLVKSNYYDFNIYYVTEISVKNKTAYLIKLESKTSWKMINVVDDEMEVIQEYQKG